MKWRDVGILALIVLLLGGYVYFQNSRESEPEAIPTATPLPVDLQPVNLLPTGVTAEAVNWLEIRYTGGLTETVIVRNEAGDWEQTVPEPAPLISATINSQVGQILGLTSQRTLAADANPLEAYGLAEPTAEIIIVVERESGASRQTLHIGNLVTGGTGYYVQKAGDNKVYIVSNATIDTILRLTSAPPLVPTPTAEPAVEEPADSSEATATPIP